MNLLAAETIAKLQAEVTRLRNLVCSKQDELNRTVRDRDEWRDRATKYDGPAQSWQPSEWSTEQVSALIRQRDEAHSLMHGLREMLDKLYAATKRG